MTIKEMIFDSPLYSKWKNEYLVKDEHGDNYAHFIIDDLLDFDERVQSFCPECGESRVFAPDVKFKHFASSNNSHYGLVQSKSIMIKTFRCSQDKEHQLVFGFLVDDEILVKTLEYPTKLDMSKSTIQKYRKVLPKDKISELGRAAQLESFGYSIASMLHYRRIFEFIIYKTFIDANIVDKTSEAEFRKLRMEDKIKYIKEHLPDYFTDNSFVYGILSKGIHELTEEECNEYLPVVKTIIYYSLDESLEKRNKELRKQEYSKKLASIKTKLDK